MEEKWGTGTNEIHPDDRKLIHRKIRKARACFNIPAAIKQRIEDAAARHNCSQTAYIIAQVSQGLDREDGLGKFVNMCEPQDRSIRRDYKLAKIRQKEQQK